MLCGALPDLRLREGTGAAFEEMEEVGRALEAFDGFNSEGDRELGVGGGGGMSVLTSMKGETTSDEGWVSAGQEEDDGPFVGVDAARGREEEDAAVPETTGEEVICVCWSVSKEAEK
jgi:hypothetical protein